MIKNIKTRHQIFVQFEQKMESLTLKEKFRLIQVKTMAFNLMKKHDVLLLNFKFGYSKKALGSCSSKTIIIQLNHALKSDIRDVKNTILHEIAHAIVGVKAGHRIKWQNKAIELGVTWTINYRK